MKTVTLRFDDEKQHVVRVCPGLLKPWRNLYYYDGRWFLGGGEFETEAEARENAGYGPVATVKIDLAGLEV